MFKKWQQSKAQEDHAAYKEAKRERQRDPYQLKEQEQHKNCIRNWTLETVKRLSIGSQNLETRQPKITTKVNL